MNAFGILWRTAVLYLGLATALPTSVRSLGPHSKPARDYEAATQLARAFQRADTAAAIGGESIILLHGPRTPRALVTHLEDSAPSCRVMARATTRRALFLTGPTLRVQPWAAAHHR